jgi:hypothetical protein
LDKFIDLDIVIVLWINFCKAKGVVVLLREKEKNAESERVLYCLRVKFDFLQKGGFGL